MGNSPTVSAASASVSKLTALSNAIDDKTRLLARHLEARGSEIPSLGRDGPADFPLAEMDDEARQARLDILALTQELHELVLGPRQGLRDLAWDVVSHVPLHAIAEFDIAAAVPPNGSISYESLSAEIHKLKGVHVPPRDLRRLLRLAMTSSRLFLEQDNGRVSHNRKSLLLLQDKSLASWVGMFTVDLFGPVANTVPAMCKWPASEKDNETGVNVSCSHSMSFFEYLQADEARARRYKEAMGAMSSGEGFGFSHTVESYPWQSLGHGTVVDMGGNEGSVSMAIAEAFPTLSFIVQDLPGVRTPAVRAKVPAHLSGRVELTTHDFFEEQPVVAEAYFFRHVFHAFSDEYAVRILRALVPALRTGAHIIVNDAMLPAPGSVSCREEKSIRILDVLVKTACNSREREVDDWKRLFEQADARFKWQQAWKSSGRLWLIQVLWEE
ncbi:hypothetical protein G6O67_007882 [Ophiocordyceps sinensis]|uniref:O-methyltransferase C-terminal domain-containing protein n=2 Tax=Ophiocordyceps sinensis TaxID=72228 RepID=A0A8H4PJW6_9HYPO|nr:O-methyltransferase, family 2 [Ophiocordyceps sinensis CO18]KAF4504431.1 hypothetical protein G6O67_007882 [Ophiocordyceps sinensis]